jgi:hypothetical protein
MEKRGKQSIELIWDKLLSRDPQIIISVFNHLNQSEKNTVLEHLRKMNSEAGWLPVQKESAEAALQAIEKIKRK